MGGLHGVLEFSFGFIRVGASRVRNLGRFV